MRHHRKRNRRQTSRLACPLSSGCGGSGGASRSGASPSMRVRWIKRSVAVACSAPGRLITGFSGADSSASKRKRILRRQGFLRPAFAPRRLQAQLRKPAQRAQAQRCVRRLQRLPAQAEVRGRVDQRFRSRRSACVCRHVLVQPQKLGGLGDVRGPRRGFRPRAAAEPSAAGGCAGKRAPGCFRRCGTAGLPARPISVCLGRPRNGRHSVTPSRDGDLAPCRKGPGAAAAQQVLEHGFGLIVLMVRQQQRVRAALLRAGDQQPVARVARRGFRARRVHTARKRRVVAA